ncbi:MAG: hypothetical protein M1820_009900 [Bogoriella megaspora]|nr:MAG: hypothetical protein M1820_009900 [Bogoriella megaspora]
MAKIKPAQKSKNKRKKSNTSQQTHKDWINLFAQAQGLYSQGMLEDARQKAQSALKITAASSTLTLSSLCPLNLLSAISLDLGDIEKARNYLLECVTLDPEGEVSEDLGGGAEKFFSLAQLSEEGGKDSVQWIKKGINVLQREILTFEIDANPEDLTHQVKKRKLASALCSIVEIYMTDLSWDEDAEAQCETLVTEAMLVSPDNPEVLQTLASVRISQTRIEDARSALKRGLALWINLPPLHEDVPEFPGKISLCRLLLEVDLQDDAMDILHLLVLEDDQSVEAWYLGGFCRCLMARAQRRNEAQDKGQGEGTEVFTEEEEDLLRSSRKWLLKCLKLYAQQDYEDEPLKAHAEQLLAELDEQLGPVPEGEEADENGNWEDTESDESEDGDDDEDGDDEMEETPTT